MAHLQQHARLFAPAGVLAFEEKIEELALQLAAVVRVKMSPVLNAVRFEPLFFRRGPHEPFEVAARVQTVTTPVGGREQRRGGLVPLRRAALVILVVERMRANFSAEIAAVFRKLL